MNRRTTRLSALLAVLFLGFFTLWYRYYYLDSGVPRLSLPDPWGETDTPGGSGTGITDGELESSPGTEPGSADSDPGLLTGGRRANATILVLARNSDLEGIIKSVRALEDRFNARYGYPYVFLNDEEWEEGVKERIQVLSSSKMEFGVIPLEMWSMPDWIDEDEAKKAWQRMENEGVKYGGSVSYRNMCRFNAGLFYQHPLMQQYRYYWRVEPNVQFFCNIEDDPIVFMEDNDKVYGFTIAVYEIPETIRSLWKRVTEFTSLHPEYVSEKNAMELISGTHGRTYNRCHFWSNFEIADLSFFRSPAYTAFFEHLDQAGGFYYERWGDAPIHTLAASLLLPYDKIHWFEEIGYQHDDWGHCPVKKEMWEEGRCSCDRYRSFDDDPSSCLMLWHRFMRDAKASQ